MAKVIVERPRIGSRLRSRKKGYRKYLQTTGLENLPAREPMLGRWHGMDRYLNEHLGPMRRFLRSQVGRPWNKVHHDLCEHVSFDNAVQKHVLSHVFDYVRRHVTLEGGKVLIGEGWFRGRVLEPGSMYICPVSGLLKIVRNRKASHKPQRTHPGKPTQFHQRNGTWWEVRLREAPDNPGELWDVWLERPLASVGPAELQSAFGGKLTAISKRLLTVTEARTLRRSLRKQGR